MVLTGLPKFDPDDVAIGQRLTQAVLSLSDNVGTATKRAAEIAGCSANSFRRWQRGEVSADAKGLARIAEATSRRLEWLIGGRAPEMVVATDDRQSLDDEHHLVPILGVVVSAGGGNEVVSEEVTGYIQFPKSMLRRLGDPAKLQLIPVNGDSAEPELRDGDLAMIDTSRVDRTEGLLVVSIDHALVAKRLRFRGGGKAELLSTNPDYPPVEVDMTQQQLSIKGRVVWAGKFY